MVDLLTTQFQQLSEQVQKLTKTQNDYLHISPKQYRTILRYLNKQASYELSLCPTLDPSTIHRKIRRQFLDRYQIKHIELLPQVLYSEAINYLVSKSRGSQQLLNFVPETEIPKKLNPATEPECYDSENCGSNPSGSV